MYFPRSSKKKSFSKKSAAEILIAADNQWPTDPRWSTLSSKLSTAIFALLTYKRRLHALIVSVVLQDFDDNGDDECDTGLSSKQQNKQTFSRAQ